MTTSGSHREVVKNNEADADVGHGLLACLLMATLGAIAIEPADAQPTGFYILAAGDESALDAIVRTSATDPGLASAVAPLARSWEIDVEAGRTVTGINDQPLSSAESSELRELASGKVVVRPDLRAATPSPAASNGVGILAVTPTNPNSFPVRGQTAGDTSYWTNLTAVVAVKVCNSKGCTDTGERISTKSTVTPSTKTSKVALTLSHVNKSKITNWKIRVFAVCSGAICGADRYDKPKVGGPTYYISSNSDRHGKVLTIAVGLEGYAGNWAYDGSKTKDCKGSTKRSDNRCWYQWNKA